jgi:hypothetical protein
VRDVPPGQLAEADQVKAHADVVTGRMVRTMRQELADGIDPTYLWWTYGRFFATEPPWMVAAALTSALLRLAEAQPREG